MMIIRARVVRQAKGRRRTQGREGQGQRAGVRKSLSEFGHTGIGFRTGTHTGLEIFIAPYVAWL
jgi:hypothetical protein